MIYFITGRSKSGKTSFAYHLKEILEQYEKSVVILDGDEIRDEFPIRNGFSDKGRRKQILRIAKLAKIFEKQNVIVIIALVSPKKSWRQEARKMFEESKLIYLPRGILWPGTTYEEPDNDEMKGE